jgi:hypothetical protein
MAILKALSSTGSCSWQGEEFQIKDGLVEVPDDAVPEFLAHGFTYNVDEQPDPATQPTTPLSQWRNDDLKAKAAEIGLDVTGMDRPQLIKAVCEAVKAQQVGQ